MLAHCGKSARQPRPRELAFRENPDVREYATQRYVFCRREAHRIQHAAQLFGWKQQVSALSQHIMRLVEHPSILPSPIV